MYSKFSLDCYVYWSDLKYAEEGFCRFFEVWGYNWGLFPACVPKFLFRSSFFLIWLFSKIYLNVVFGSEHDLVEEGNEY